MPCFCLVCGAGRDLCDNLFAMNRPEGRDDGVVATATQDGLPLAMAFDGRTD
jgi:hypothetical protein